MELEVGLEGWIAGLIAAALTILSTVTWEARTHRRRQLDDAVLALATMNQRFSAEMLKMAQPPRPVARIADLLRDVQTAQVLVGALARRRVLGLPASLVAPTRAGLARTIGVFDDQFNEFDVPIGAALDPEGWIAAVDRGLDALNAQSAACLVWLSNPWAFGWNRDRSKAAVERWVREPI